LNVKANSTRKLPIDNPLVKHRRQSSAANEGRAQRSKRRTQS
jgi:hypothetical protein